MKALLIGLFVTLVCTSTHAVEVTVTAFGDGYKDALSNAKVAAVEQAASTFLTGRRILINGEIKEAIGQYNGGFIQKYTVTDTNSFGARWWVTIQATVSTEKINQIAIDGSSSPDSVKPKVEQSADEYTKTKSALETINKVSNPFVIVVDGSDYSTDDKGRVDIVYKLHLEWNPKWVDDVKVLNGTIGRLIYESQKGVCWGPKRASTYTCGGMAILPDFDMWKRIYYNIVIGYEDGTSESRQTLTTYAAELFTYHWEQKVNNESASTASKRKVAQVVGAVTPVIGTLISGLAANPSYSVVEVLTIHPDVKSAQFKTYVPSVEMSKFKKISKVSFVPAVDQAGCWKNNHC